METKMPKNSNEEMTNMQASTDEERLKQMSNTGNLHRQWLVPTRRPLLLISCWLTVVCETKCPQTNTLNQNVII